MEYVVQDVLHTNLIKWNVGGMKMFLEGLPGSVVSILCGLAQPCLEDISGVAREVLERVDPPEILQATRRLWRIWGGLPLVRSVTKSSMKGRRQTSNTFSVRNNTSHVWASQRGETRMMVPFDISSFFTTLLSDWWKLVHKREVPPLG
jgi:hypothetical protein